MGNKDLIEKKLLLLPVEAIMLLRVSRRTLYRMISSGDIQAVKVRGCMRVKSESVKQFIEKNYNTD